MNMRVDASVKKKAENIANQLGISMSTAITLFLKAMIREKGLPFAVTVEPKKAKEVRKIEKEEPEENEESPIDEKSLKKAIDLL